MSESLGMILKKLRKEQKIGQKDLCRGICSISTLSRIELGSRKPEQILFESLITRLGKDSTKWELILIENDKILFEKRNYMEYLVQTEQWEELKKEVEQYEQMRGSSHRMDQQYCCFIRSMLYRQEKNYQEALREGIEGLGKTEFYMKETLLKDNVVVSKNELRILCLIGKIWFEEGEKSTFFLYSYWNELLLYIKEKCTDTRYRLEFYIEALYYLAYIFYREKQYVKSSTYCKQGIQELIEKRSTYYLKGFLKLYKKLEKKQALSSLNGMPSIKNIDTLLETLEFWEEQNGKFQEKKRYIRAYNGVYSIGEVIKHTGNYRGKTDYYQLSIRGEDFEIQELRWEIDFYIGINKADEAEKLLHILKKKIDLTNPYNEQYVKEIELFIRDERNEVSCEEYVQEIFELLSITIKDVDRLKEDGIENCFFTREEIVLLMNLGCTYHQHKQYKEALKYYHKIEGYLRDFYQLSSAGIYKTTLLFNIGWCYGKMFLEEDCQKKEKYKRYANQYFQQSFCMAELYGDEQVKEIIRENKELWNI